MTYSQKLRDPRWQKKRLQILERDGWQCQCCKSTDKNLQVHHLFYAKLDPWDYPDSAYQTLCEDCHEKRQEVVDNLINKIRVRLGRIPTRSLAPILRDMLETVTINAEAYSTKCPVEKSDPPATPFLSDEERDEKIKMMFKAMREATK